MAIFNKKEKKKEGDHIELNTINEQNEQAEMEVEVAHPAPDYPSFNQIEGQNVAPLPQPTEIPLNEGVLQELIKKEEENLAKKENDKTKSLEEIKNNLNSLDSYFSNLNKNIYEDSYFADLKKQISK